MDRGLVRHPMAFFGFGQGLAVGLWLGSPTELAYTGVGMAIWQGFARPRLRSCRGKPALFRPVEGRGEGCMMKEFRRSTSWVRVAA